MRSTINKYNLIFMLFLFGACSDLDREYSTTMNEEAIAVEYGNLQKQVTHLYAGMRDGHYLIDNAMMASLSDEAEYTLQGNAQVFNSGSWNQYVNPDDLWAHYYSYIRRINTYLESSEKFEVNLDAYKFDPSENAQEIYKTRLKDIANWKKEARFLRAYYHFELVKRYGGIPIMKTALPLDADFKNIHRNTLQECVDFIVNECSILGGEGENGDEDALPITYNNDNLGRGTRGAALALKSRLLLYAASDLWNTDSWAQGYSHPELVTLEQKDRRGRWAEAAAAAKAVIDLSAEAGYGLMERYSDLGKVTQSPELILVRRISGNTNTFEKLNFPAGFPNGEGRVTPSQNLVDDYEMIDGSKFDWNNPEHALSPYSNRDPRLALSIYTNGSSFKNTTIETFEGGAHKRIKNGTMTGYYLRKFVDSNIDLMVNGTSNHPWVIFRISEIYLNYAEALNESNPGHPDILTYVNKTRGRSDVKMIPIGDTDQDVLRKRIRNERRIELAFEDHRLWDARRWMIATDVLNADLTGVEIRKNENETFTYKKINVEKRVFSPKMYFYPIPGSVILNEQVMAAGWPQNPLW